MSDIKSQVREFLLRSYRITPSELNDTTALFSSGLLDSFAMVELVSFTEEKFGKKVRARDLTIDNFDSIERIERYFARDA